MAETEAQLKALAITPKITSSISIPCSVFIIKEVIAEHRNNRGKATLRALAGMSFIDILASSGWFLSTWAVPVGSNAAFAAGNTQSCTYQGFLLQIAIGAPMYNACLALYYLLTINYGWHEKDLRRIEPWLHAFVLTFAFGTGILLIPLNMYNHIGAVCWTMGLPQGCENSNYQSSDIPCERGNHAWIYGFALFYGPLWVCIILTTVAMIMIYIKVRETEKRNLRYAGGVLRRSTFMQTDKVAAQAILYTIAFYITWLPSTIWSLVQWSGSPMYWLDLLATITEPSQGIMNLTVFLRPRPGARARLKRRLCCCFGTSLSAEESEIIESVVDGRTRQASRESQSGPANPGHLEARAVENGDISWHKHNVTIVGNGNDEQSTDDIIECVPQKNSVNENGNHVEKGESPQVP